MFSEASSTYMNNLGVNNGLFAKPTIGRSEYGRVKVALAPGKGFMDWLRVSSKTLAKRQPSVDHNELSKHDKKDDCWVHLFGTVYDVTKYLDFHPGGIPELMRGAGRDATPLFNQYHAWVNYESMLKACVVGPFVGDLSKLRPVLPPTTTENENLLGPNSFTFENNSLFGSRIEALENGVSISHNDWNELTDENVIVTVKPAFVKTAITSQGDEITSENWRLRVLVHPFFKPSMEFEFEPTSLSINDEEFNIKIIGNSVRVTFPTITCPETFTEGKCKVQRRPGVSYHECNIPSISRINHDTLLFTIEIPKNIYYRIPVGHHVSIKVRKGNSSLYRPYTPIKSRISNELDNRLDFMIKIYEDGICTPSIAKLNIGDKIEISDPIGDKNFSEWIRNSDELILLAAGTGITPMIDVIGMRIRENRGREDRKTYILMFNKKEKDVQVKGEEWVLRKWVEESENSQQIVFLNILSDAEDPTNPDYLHGRVSTYLLQSNIHISPSDCTKKAFICGPNGFMLAAKKSLEEIGLTSEDVHVFDG